MSNSLEDEKLKKKLLIEELRCTYEHLRTVNNVIDSKSAVFLTLPLLTLSVIIASLIDLFSTPIIKCHLFTIVPLKILVIPYFLVIPISLQLTLNLLVESIYLVICISIIIYILKGLYYLLRIVRIKKFSDPFTYPPNDVLKLLDLNYGELEDYTIIEYRQANAHYHCVVDEKSELLKEAIPILEYGFVLAFIVIIVLIYFKMVSGIYV